MSIGFSTHIAPVITVVGLCGFGLVFPHNTSLALAALAAGVTSFGMALRAWEERGHTSGLHLVPRLTPEDEAIVSAGPRPGYTYAVLSFHGEGSQWISIIEEQAEEPRARRPLVVASRIQLPVRFSVLKDRVLLKVE